MSEENAVLQESQMNVRVKTIKHTAKIIIKNNTERERERSKPGSSVGEFASVCVHGGGWSRDGRVQQKQFGN